MKKVDVLIAVPTYDSKIYIETSKSITNTIIALMKEKASGHLISISACAFISHARNLLVSEFIARKEKTHLLFVDADMEWSPHTILRLLKANVPVAAAPYVAKNYDYPLPNGQQYRDVDTLHAAAVNWNVQFEDPEVMTGKQKLAPVIQGFTKVPRVGAGLLLLRRDCIDMMIHKYADSEYYYGGFDRNKGRKSTQKYFGLFNTTTDEDQTFVGEDYAFCDRWVKGCGGEIWCDIDARIAHHGHHRYAGSLQESLRLRGKARESS
jgi:hypothetical protein